MEPEVLDIDRIHLAVENNLRLSLISYMPFVILEKYRRRQHPYFRLSLLVNRMIEVQRVIILGVLSSLELRLEE